MTITINDLKETAALAHLTLDENELAVMLPAFKQMVEFFAAMQAAGEDRPAFPGNSQAVGSDFFRSDCAGSQLDNEDLIGNAAERDGRFIVIPNVLERENGV